jgi:DNA-binding IclR family transcriptional regulator
MAETIETRGHAARIERSSVQVISRAAAILRVLAGDAGDLSLTQLAERVGLPRTTVHRICRALEQEGFIDSDAVSGRLHLGSGLLRLTAGTRRDLPTLVAPFLDRLSRELNETVDLGVLDGSQVLFIAQHPAPQRVLMAVSRVGARFPAYCTSNGKALLAQLPDEEVLRLVPRKLEVPARGTLTTRDELLAELDEVRRSGLGFDREDHRAGICAVGVALRDIDGSHASVSVPIPASRYYQNEERVVSALLRTRDEIQQKLLGG